MGIFYANPAKDSYGNQRCADGEGTCLCKARILASHQAVAAILNSALTNGATLPVSREEIASILGGTDVDAIMALAATLDDYNNSGDYEPIIDVHDYAIQPAEPKTAKGIANTAIADCSPTLARPTAGGSTTTGGASPSVAPAGGSATTGKGKGNTAKAAAGAAIGGLAAALVPIAIVVRRRPSVPGGKK